ncbi:hypothetical protein ACN9M0_22350 [Streptomyces sp. R-07]|uniref:hypothetical protein n=1 Tax=unclassified Streptomyces TaxID=2593676 RepID=UPI003432038C
MIVFLLILAFFLTVGTAGLYVALNVKDSAVRLEQNQLRNHALRAQARGDLEPPSRFLPAVGFRLLGGILALCGLGLPATLVIVALSA